MVEEGQPEPEFNRILDIVDPNRYERAYFVLYHLIFPATAMSPYKSTWLS